MELIAQLNQNVTEHHHLLKSAFSLLRGVTVFCAMMTLPPSTSCLEHPPHLDQPYGFLSSPDLSMKSYIFLSILCHPLPDPRSFHRFIIFPFEHMTRPSQSTSLTTSTKLSMSSLVSLPSKFEKTKTV